MASPPDPVWMRWQRDNQLHLFRGRVGEAGVTLCALMVPVADLAEPEGEDEQRCMQCLLNWGGELADRHGDRDRYAP